MLQEKKALTKIFNYVCILLVLVMAVMQFMPYFEIKGGETASLAKYGWLPNHLKALTNQLKSFTGNRSLDAKYIATSSGIVLAAAVLYLIFGIKDARKEWPLLLPLAASGYAIFSFLAYPEFKAGASWIVHLILYAVTFVVALVPFILMIVKAVKKK